MIQFVHNRKARLLTNGFHKEKWEWYSGLPGNSHSIMVTWKNVSCYRCGKEYLGHTVNFKTRKHFKDKKSHYVAQKYWQVFEDTQEPIIDEETFYNAQKCRTGIKRYPNGWGAPHPLDGKMICFDCGSLMYCHRTSNGKKVAQFDCAKYGKQPVGTLCSSGHRINADAVIEIVRDTLRYLKTSAKMITEKVGQRIKELRTEMGLSQEKLALKAEIDRTYLAGAEQGKRNT